LLPERFTWEYRHDFFLHGQQFISRRSKLLDEHLHGCGVDKSGRNPKQITRSTLPSRTNATLSMSRIVTAMSGVRSLNENEEDLAITLAIAANCQAIEISSEGHHRGIAGPGSC
jgi:hypothetical protein